VRQLPEARELRRELVGGDGEAAALHAAVEASAGHGEGQGGAHELQRVEAAVVRERKRRRQGWKGLPVVRERKRRRQGWKGLPTGAVTASSPTGTKMADSALIFVDDDS
jgi:hypothetical protein